MLRRLLWITTAVVLVVLIVLLMVARMEGSRQRREDSAHRPVVRQAILGLLDERGGIEVEDLVPGNEIAPGRYDFRGATRSDFVSLPLYGIAELNCAELSADLSCWSLILLERDGRAMALVPEPEDLPAATMDTEPEAPAADWDADVEDAGTTADAGDAEVVGDTADAGVTAPAPEIYRVTVERANGRAEPGTDSAVVASIDPDRRLILLEAGEEWGRFSFETPREGEAEEFWVWYGLVTEVSGTP